MGIIIAMHLGYLLLAAAGLAVVGGERPGSVRGPLPGLRAVLGCIVLAPGLFISGHAIVPTFALLALVAHIGTSTSLATDLFLFQLLATVGPMVLCWTVALALRLRASRQAAPANAAG